MEGLLNCLINASEKAANIARACRREPALFALLVEEKTGEEKNAKFAQDFKTLADVLIQETVRQDLSRSYPQLRDSIFGEESSKFTNQLGESVTVNIESGEDSTREMLSKVLNNNDKAAELLANEVHSNISQNDSMKQCEINCDLKTSFDLDDLGIWIDPIDATSQYIKGREEKIQEGSIPIRGLEVVTVLIGVFSKTSGAPILGVVNQPFSPSGPWAVYWGVHFGGNLFTSETARNKETWRPKPRLLIGSSEKAEIVEKLSEHFEVVRAGGAGNKLLMVVLGLADVYINTGASTYQWDTCGPHVILRSMGGGLVDCTTEFSEIVYSINPDTSRANSGGILAFREQKYLELTKKILTSLAQPNISS